MKLKHAIAKRIYSLESEKNISYRLAADRGGCGQSTLNAIVTERVDAKVETIRKISKGFGINLQVFFAHELFHHI